MAVAGDPAALLNVVSGVLMGVLGLALLASKPDKDWNRLFGLLAVFWCIQIVSANTVRLTEDPSQALLAGKITLAFLIPLYFFFVSFASIFPRPRPPFGTSGLAVAALALPAAAALVVLFVRPELLLAGVSRTAEGGLTLNWGPLLPYLVTAPFFGSVSYALYVMMRRLEEPQGSTEAQQVGAVLGAFGLYTAYYAPRKLVAFGKAGLAEGAVEQAGRLETWLIAGIMLVTVGILVAVVLGLLRRLRGRGPHRSPARTALVLVSVGLAGALAVETVALAGGPDLDLLGLFRSGSVAIIVYAIARYQLFDLELRAKRWTAVGAAVLAAGTLAAAAFVGLRSLEVDLVANATATTLIAAVALVPALHASFRLADRVAPDVSRRGDHLYLRKLEVYRAAVERKRREAGTVDPQDPDLVEQRERLGLQERDHGVVATLTEPPSGSQPPSVDPGQEVFGKYELEDVIAEGGFGRVLRARDTMLGRRVVIKELLAQWREDEAIAQRFLQEARIAGQLDHPHVVSVYGIEEHGGDHFLVMEHVPGGTLEDRLAAGPLAPDEAVRVAEQVLDALSAAHEQGIVHRDVKPANILFDEEDEVKLTDFGIAHLTRDDPEATVAGLETSPGTQPGTVAYMSPEQAAGEPVDARSDLYSTAALLYRCLAGRPPVDVEDQAGFQARQRVAEAEVPDLDAVPEPLQGVLERGLAPDPEDRFPTAEAFREALAACPPTADDAPAADAQATEG